LVLLRAFGRSAVMRDANARWTHSPERRQVRMFGSGPVQNPKRVSHPYPSGASSVGRMRTSRGWSILWGAGGGMRVSPKKRVRGGWAKSRPRLLRVALKGGNPGEQPAAGVLNMLWPPGTLARVKAQKPRLAEPARVLRHSESTAR